MDNRPFLRDCPFCKAHGGDIGTVMFTAEKDVVDDFAYSYTIRCCGCGSSLTDEYAKEVVRLWNGEEAKDEDADLMPEGSNNE